MKKIIMYPLLAILTPASVFIVTVLIKAITNTYDIKVTPKDENIHKLLRKSVIIDKIGEVVQKGIEKIKPLITKVAKKLKSKTKEYAK